MDMHKPETQICIEDAEGVGKIRPTKGYPPRSPTERVYHAAVAP